MANRRKRKSGGGGIPFGWFLAGLLIGLLGAAFLFNSGVIPGAPERPAERPGAGLRDEPELLGNKENAPAEPRYDFFTVLPEMEVVVPQRELSDQASPPDPATSAGDAEAFVLQAGSFRSASDADQMKARLALLGSVATIQQVTVDGQTWHRVRIGPVQGAREADQLRRRLQDNGVDVLVLKVSS